MTIRDPRPYIQAYVGQPYCYGMRAWLVNAVNVAAKRKQYPGSAKNIPSEGPINGTKIGLDCIGAICAACSVEKSGDVMGDRPTGMSYYAARNGKPGNVFMDAVSAEGARLAWGAKPISSIPEPTADRPGIVVFMAARNGKSGHIGMYIGNGEVCEATPPRVQITNLKNRRTSGGSTRQWESWAYIPAKWLQYADLKWGISDVPAPETPAIEPQDAPDGLHVGDRVRIKQTGIPYYPGQINIPGRLKGVVFTVNGVDDKHGGRARLKEITTWCLRSNLEKAEDRQ